MPENEQSQARNWQRVLARLRRRVLSRHLILARIVVFSALFLLLIAVIAGARQLAESTGIASYFRMAGSFLFLPKDKVQERDGRTNILLLGKAGTDPVLTDTMIFASVDHNSPRVDMISIPRDIWMPEFKDKINSAYSRGNEKEAGGGLVLAKSVVEEVLGQPVHYAVAFDFNGFSEIIDIIGGVEVDVERAFIDKKYPIAGREDDACGGADPEFLCRYETISFQAGKQWMDGATALKYARSRHSEDPLEGTDLARATRQQKVLIAMKDKLADKETFLSFSKMSRLWQTFWEVTETDMDREQLAYIARLFADSRDQVSSQTIPEDYLLAPPYSEEYNNLFVFIPAAGDWQQVHDWVASIF